MGIDIDLGAIREGLRGHHEPLELIVHPDRDRSELYTRFVELAEAVVTAAPHTVVIAEHPNQDLPAEPGLSLRCGSRGGVHYLALPEGQEAAPFVEAVLTVACGLDGLAADWTPQLTALELPAELWVFVATACPHCPVAVRTANRIAVASPLVSSVIIDAQRYPKLAESFHAKSVPLTLIDGGLSLTGIQPAQELVDHLLGRGTLASDTLVFTSLIEIGRLDEAGRRLRLPQGPAALARAWRASTTSSRVGMLLVCEQVLEESRSCLDAGVAELLPALEADDAALQGDTADLLGRIGLAAARPGLEALLSHPNPDVVEIAEEALEEIDARSEQDAATEPA